MARQVKTILIDDLTGGDAQETISFALSGREYVIDLNAANADQLRSDLAPWISAARTIRRPTGKRPYRFAYSAPQEDLRVWARANGFTVADRGRIPRKIDEAYRAAHI